MAKIIEGNDKSKVLRLLERIYAEKFEAIDVHALFFELREYSREHSLFRELAHFIAHPERNKGKFVDYFISYSEQVRFVWNYRINGETLNIFEPFPEYISNLLYNRVSKINKDKLQRNFNYTPSKLKKEIKRKILNNSNYSYFEKDISIQLKNVVLFCLSEIGVESEILNQSVIIDDIINTLKGINISFDEAKIRGKSDKIMLSILLLLHSKIIVIDNCNTEEQPYLSILFDGEENNVRNAKLGIFGILNSPTGDNIKIAFPIISTDLVLENYCDDVLLKEILKSKHNNEITRLLKFSDFKLTFAEKSDRRIQNAVIFIFRITASGKYRAIIFSVKDSTVHKKN